MDSKNEGKIVNEAYLLVAEEARSRHVEIQNYIKEGQQAILFSLAATGGVWGWVVTNYKIESTQIFLDFVVFLPLLFAIYSLSRWYVLEHFISINATYLMNQIYPHMPFNIIGWESYTRSSIKSAQNGNTIQSNNKLQLMN